MARAKGTMIAVTSTKGGVGKTILTLNLAGIYQDLKKRVLIIDMDLYGGAIALNLNLNPDKTIYHFVDDLSNNRYHSFYDYVLKYNEQIDILSCPKDPRQANKIDAKYIEMILDNAIYRYDVILIDTSHTLTPVNISVLDMATVILYVLTIDPLDLKNTKSFLAILHDIEKENVKVVLNDSRDQDLNYFSTFDIKNVIRHNIDYTISASFHIRNISKYLLEGQILVENTSLSFRDFRDYDKLKKMATDLLPEVKEEK